MAVAAVPRPIPHSACLLADHLDAVLAASEDLLLVKSEVPAPTAEPVDTILAARAAQRLAIERIRTLELAILARVLKSRERAAELCRDDSRFKAVARLFTAGTMPLADAVSACSDSTTCDFETGEGLTAYVRSRGLLPPDAPGLPESAVIAVNEGLLLIGVIPLGALMDLAAGFLDALEQHFQLYGTDSDELEAKLAETPFPKVDLSVLPKLPTLPKVSEGAGKLESMIETTLQVMFEPKEDKVPGRQGWAPGSLMAALSQVDDEPDHPSAAA